MRVVTYDKTHVCTKDRYGDLINEPLLVVGSTGYGKGLCTEMLAEDDHNNGNIVIVIADPKQQQEYAYQMFKPKAKYHLENLNAIFKEPKKKPVKMYHPFTFSIPNKEYLPNYNFFTIPIKDLGKHEWGLIAETHSENDAVSLLMKASEEITNEDGIYSFAHYVQDSIKGKMKGKKRLADWKNFGVEVGSGTMKELSRITGYMRPFQKHFFLSKKNSDTNIDWEKILTDQEHYHVFLTNFLDFNRDEKVIGFTILYILESIIRNQKYLNHSVTIVCPELKVICPLKPQGYKEFLAQAFTNAISTIRSIGRGIKFIGDTQNWGGLDRGIKDVIKVTLLGQLSGNDIEEVSKKWMLSKDTKEFLRKPLKPNTFITAESNDHQPHTFYLPSAMHCEPKYNFLEMYKKHSKEDSKTYPLIHFGSLIKTMREELKREENKVKEKVKRKEKVEELEEEKAEKEKESNTSEKEKQEEKVKKIKEKTTKTDEALEKLCYEMHKEPEKHNLKSKKDGTGSARDIAKKLTEMGFEGVKTHVSVVGKINKYKVKLEEDKDKDFAEEFIESVKD